MSKVSVSERSDTAPRWLPCAVSFIAGVAVAAGFLMPQITTPDYKRGHANGYKQGLEDRKTFYGKVNYDQGFQDGIRSVKE